MTLPFGTVCREGPAEEARPAMFGWTYHDGSGEELGSSQRFPDAEAAEEWMGTCWQDLLANGVEEVVLHDHARGAQMYRMGLGAE
ncbi:MAG TPA: hypothetical protein VK962_00840 [Actinomycetota bacterium]|nr:hypothetical protein [Actinomycetota bacterium]